MEYTLSKMRDHTNLQWGIAIPDGCAAIRRDLSGLETHEVQSQEMQCPVPEGNPRNQYPLQQGVSDWMEGSLAEKHPGSCWTKSSVFLWPRQTAASWAAQKRVLTVGWKRWFFPSTQHWRDTPQVLSSLLGSPESLGSKSGERPHRWSGIAASDLCGEPEIWGCSAWRRGDSRVILRFFGSTWWRKGN